MILKFFILFCLLLSFGQSQAQQEFARQRSGPVSSNAFNLSAYDASWKMQKWEQLKGKKQLLITFFPKCFTGTCTFQLKSLSDSYRELQKAGVEVWAISTDEADGPKGQRAFAKSLKLPFPLIPDPSRKLCLQFGAVQSPLQTAERMSILIGKDGKVKWVDKQINPRTHGADVLDRLHKEGIIPQTSATANAAQSGKN